MSKLINQYEIWIADLNARIGTEPGKTRPVLTIQTNLLNKVRHPSTITCSITSQVANNSILLRVHLRKVIANINKASDIMIDQMRSIDNTRLINKIGELPVELIEQVKENIPIVLDLE